MPAPLILASIMTAMAFIAFPANAQIAVGEEHCVVNVRPDDALNMRSAGSASSRVVSKLRYGRCGVMVVANCKGQWCPIEDGHNGGWVNRRFISMVSPAMYCVDGISGQKRLPVRAYPSDHSRVIKELLPNQCEIQFLPYSTHGWQKIRVSGYEGWTLARHLSGQ
ncbi:SH3 domain-containing protein [Sinorhizobium meliloti]|uniref:SH3 domain-containing protein n=1 Tax=Rhizobium meliloti TaxID=382 RepID=UPI0013E2FF87|nr:SH3 domain-containing protein [Sinorhizobium meliloti]